MKKIIVIISLFGIGICGCSGKYLKTDKMVKGLAGIKHLAQGEYYLDQQDYTTGLRTFRKELKKNPDDARVHYYLGRFYMAKKLNKAGMNHLIQATQLDSGNADYHFWLGVAYSENKKPDAERKSYQRALAIDKDHSQALTYLGHNQYERKEYQTALKTYTRVLELDPVNPAALYNRALLLRRFKRVPEEIEAWKIYLDHYPSGAYARQATRYLNQRGDFDHRNHVIGMRRVTIPRIRFIPLTTEIDENSEPALDFIGHLVEKYPRYTLHVITYQLNNAELAERRAKNVKRYLLKRNPRIYSSRIKVSWFKQPEKIKVDRKQFLENQSVNFFTVRHRR
jgi:tetratricopeptide (TPR) repeat protein